GSGPDGGGRNRDWTGGGVLGQPVRGIAAIWNESRQSGRIWRRRGIAGGSCRRRRTGAGLAGIEDRAGRGAEVRVSGAATLPRPHSVSTTGARSRVPIVCDVAWRPLGRATRARR